MFFIKIKHFFKVIRNKLSALMVLMNSELYSDNENAVKLNLKNPGRIIKVLIGKEINIRYVEMVLTTVCNLNCKGCSALMNYYNKPYHIDLDKNIKALQKLIDSCDSIYVLRLLGGEPFCYPYLYDILEYLTKQDKVKNVSIVTNGTFQINDTRILEILKNKKFFLSISDYGEVSTKFEQLIKQLNENNIKYIPMIANYQWIDYGGFDKRNRNEKELNNQFLSCTHKKMSFLEGKLFYCFRCSHSTNLKLVDLRKEDYINLLDENTSSTELRKKLYKFLYKYVPYIASCDYCDCVKNTKNISRGMQIKKEKKI